LEIQFVVWYFGSAIGFDNSTWQFWFCNLVGGFSLVIQFGLAIQLAISFGTLIWQFGLANQLGNLFWQVCLSIQQFGLAIGFGDSVSHFGSAIYSGSSVW
jgi:hypothetical protein